jgi:predicted Zn-dependent protease
MTIALLAALLIAPTGQAYTMMTNDSGAPLSWKQMPIKVAINPDNPFGLSDDEVEDAVLNAMESWESVGAAVEFEYLGFTDTQEMGFDGENVVFFTDQWQEGSSKAAMTYNWTTEDGAIVAFDIGVNSQNWEWTTDEIEPRMDLENVMAHELGHVLGLGHSDIDDLATMWESTTNGELIKRSLRPDDENGLLAIYGTEVPMGLACSSSGGGASLGWLVGLAAAGLCLRRRREG